MMSMARSALRRSLLLAQTRSTVATTSAATTTQLQSALFFSTSSSSPPQVQPREHLHDPSILAHIVCPISKYPLRYDTERGALICDEIHVAYPIRYGVPMLVPSEARIINHESTSDSNATPTLS